MGIQRKVTGLENLVTQVEDAKCALKILEKEIEEMKGRSVPDREIERLIDARMLDYRNNAIVMTLVREFKARICS